MTEPEKIRVFSVDDHPLMHEGIAAVIRKQPDIVLVGKAFDGHQAIQRFREHTPDVTLLDLRLPDMSGVDAMAAIRSEFPEAKIIILTTFAGDVEISRALEGGARAYVLKSSPPKEIVDVIRQVHAGKKKLPPDIAANLGEHFNDEKLTEREAEVLQLIADGNRSPDIAKNLFITEETVKKHIQHILEKLDVTDRTQAVAIGVRRGIIQL